MQLQHGSNQLIKETSSVATSTNEDAMENASIDSIQKMDEKKIIIAASLQNESSSQYSVGLNIFEELSHKYHRELKS